MVGILKFYLHIIMHEITAFIMCTERNWTDLVNQGTKPIFLRTVGFMFIGTLKPVEFFLKEIYIILHGLFYGDSVLVVEETILMLIWWVLTSSL